MPIISRLIGNGIGVASEVIASHKKEKQQQEVSSNDGRVEHSDVYEDDEFWELDDAADDIEPRNETSRVNDSNDGEIMHSFILRHPQRPTNTKLPYPVLVPQRRPRKKDRGFVRAYAPVLADCGIDQQTFLDFIDDFYKSSQASPWINVVNLASFGIGMVPTISTQITSAVLQVSAGTVKALQSRYRTHTFLDFMNEELFRPHGLFCMIMTFKPESSDSLYESLDVNRMIAKTITPSSNALKEKMSKLTVSSGTTHGEVSLPAIAPLIFPAIDSAANKDANVFKKSSYFVQDYLDRRAQAQYSHENPGSSLSVPQRQEFASRYSDPNHPASSGSLLALVTGGHLTRRSVRQRRRERRAERDEMLGRPSSRTADGGREGVIKRLLKQDVLYLMIVNMPSAEEIEAAQALL